MYVCVCMYVHKCIHVCMHTYICVCTDTYILVNTPDRMPRGVRGQPLLGLISDPLPVVERKTKILKSECHRKSQCPLIYFTIQN
jgi:hypothetical protein